MEGWQEQGNCRQLPAFEALEVLYPDFNDAVAVELGKAVCDGCVVSTYCLEDAMKNKESDGIRAGTTPKERGYIRAKRRRRGKRT